MVAKHYVNLKVVEEFLRRKIYPKEIAKDKGKKANFRRTCKNFSIKDRELFYKKSRKVIFDEQQKIEIVYDIHKGIGENALTGKPLVGEKFSSFRVYFVIFPN